MKSVKYEQIKELLERKDDRKQGSRCLSDAVRKKSNGEKEENMDLEMIKFHL